KDIKKLKIVMADKSQSIKGLDLSQMKQDIRSEDFNDMVQMRQGKNSFTVFVKEKHEKPVGFAGIINSEDGLILVDLEGYIQPEVIQQLIEGKINLGALTKIYDLTKPENNKEKQPKK
ncbi:MAG: DUF4252 domain-containing protein, partial [Bacteroidales bacterium]|nr:DUF4252 domain-containing protein [Bacteroidales bacterium]